MSGFSAFDWLTFLTILLLTFSLFLVITGAFTAYFGGGKTGEFVLGPVRCRLRHGRRLRPSDAGPPSGLDSEYDREGVHRDRWHVRRAARHHRGPHDETGDRCAGERQIELGRGPQRLANAARSARGGRRPRPRGERGHPRG